MALGTAATIGIGLGLSALGSAMNARSQNQAAKRQTRYNAGQAQYLRSMMQREPGAAEARMQGALDNWQGPMEIAAPQTVTAGTIRPSTFNPQQYSGRFDPTSVVTDQVRGPAGFERVGGPGYSVETVASDFKPELTNVGSWLNQYGFNTGQDAIMQTLRADPRTKVDQTLEGIIDQRGMAFDTSEMFDALGVIDQRRMDRAASEQFGQFAGIGQRFGSQAQILDTELRRQMVEDAALRDAQIQMAAYESGMGRMMEAIPQLTQREQFNRDFTLRGGTQLQNASLGAAGAQTAGVQTNNAANETANMLRFQAAQQNNAAQAARAGLDLQAGIANQQAGLDVSRMRLQAGIANQGANLQAAQFNNEMALASEQLALSGVQVNNQSMQAAAELIQRGDIAQIQAELQAAGMNQDAQMQAQELALRAQQGDQQARIQLMGMIAQAEEARQRNNTALAMAAAQTGQPVSGPGYGGVVGDMGNAILMTEMLREGKPGGNLITNTDYRFG